MKELFPSNPEQDKQALLNMANNIPADIPQTKDYINESASVPEGSMPLDINNVSDFAKLAGITEKQKIGSAGQAKGNEPMPKLSKPTTGNETPHPLKDKLVGEDDIDVKALTPAAATLGGALDPDMDESALIALGLKKASDGQVLSDRERQVIKPYVALFSELITNPAFRNNIISMQKTLKKVQGKDKDEVEEKAVSKKQQQFFGIVRSMQKGEKSPEGEAGKVAKDMSKKDVKDFAKTKHKGLPNKVESIKEELYKALSNYK